jgi:hypothetical protein
MHGLGGEHRRREARPTPGGSLLISGTVIGINSRGRRAWALSGQAGLTSVDSPADTRLHAVEPRAASLPRRLGSRAADASSPGASNLLSGSANVVNVMAVITIAWPIGLSWCSVLVLTSAAACLSF